MKIHSIILAGGSGTRLWPLSRKKMPKQFMNLTDNVSLLQSTIKRLQFLDVHQDFSIICNQDHKYIVSDQVKKSGLESCSILVEPVSRNTAIAIYVATIEALEHIDKDNTIFLVVPSDHLIKDNKGFKATIEEACKVAQEDRIVTLGIKPDQPSSLYGYIKKNHKSNEIEAFIEKPDLLTAKEFIEKGGYLWNSGMFLYKADTFLNEVETYSKKLMKYGDTSLEQAKINDQFIELDKPSFKLAPNTSIDYALMEKTSKASVVPMQSDWSDLGSYEQLFEALPKDENGNHFIGDVINIRTNNSYIKSSHKLVATIGVNKLNIIDTDDVLLVSSRDNASTEELKEIIETLDASGRTEIEDNRKVIRPWGWYDSLENKPGFQVKHIFVNPNSSISLQRHKHRSEHWTVVKGKGLITLGEEKFQLSENESVFIPKETVHRLENNSEDPVEIIEVQYGSYLGEDDIERFEDIFGRE